MCKTAKEVWHTLIITLKGNSQVKNYKIDILTQEYKKFSISNEETIDSGFRRFNAIVTSLKSLDPDYSSKNHVRKFLRALPLKWRAKVTAIKEAKDLATLPLYELIENLKGETSNDMIVKMEVMKTQIKKKKPKLLIFWLRPSVSSSVWVIGSNAEIDLAMVVIDTEKAACRKPKENKAFIGGTWSDSEDGDEKPNDATCLMAIDSQEVVSKPSSSNIDLNIVDLQNKNEELLKFNKDFAKIFKKLLNEKRSLEKENSKLSSKINDLQIEIKKLANNKRCLNLAKHVM
ncbi:hypothetical protein Tco_0194670 [Tanacetum coccineum]